MANNNPHAWLGLLKWSLSFTDGTSTDENKPPPTPLSEEDKAFLEKVMKDGIVDETTRIREILNLFIDYLEQKVVVVSEDAKVSSKDTEDDDMMIDRLWELRDLIGLIDYSKVFVTMGGLPFLLGCISQQRRDSIPDEIRGICLVLLATLAQNNPFVQTAALALKLPVGATDCNILDRLIRLYLVEEESGSGNMQGRIIQALSCIIRGHNDAEEEICRDEEFIGIMHRGLGCSITTNEGENTTASEGVRKRCLFLVQALLCSDTTSYTRIQTFTKCIQQILLSIGTNNEESSLEIRETKLHFIHTLLLQKKNIQLIYLQKEEIIAAGTARIHTKDVMEDLEEKERLSFECNLWKEIIQELNNLNLDDIVTGVDDSGEVEEEEEVTPPLMLGAPPSHDTFAQ